jgi:6,7-dimethyl-8-ribityllumazine synthase
MQTRIGIIASRFHDDIVDRLTAHAQERLSTGGIPAAQQTLIRVPGAFELPLVAQELAQSDRVDGILCLGCVIRGETDHYDHICRVVADGIARVNLDTAIPVMFGVITAPSRAAAEARAGGPGAKKDLGTDGATALLEMIEVMKGLR